MKNQKDRSKTLLNIAIVLSFVFAGISFACLIIMAFDLFGMQAVYGDMLKQLDYQYSDLNSEITITCLEMGMTAFVDLFAGLKYRKIVRMGGISKFSSPFGQVFWQFLLGSFLPSLIAYIGILKLLREPRVVTEERTKSEFMSDFKMQNMSEAITRLKELKEKGAISEEEYYETLNKILES